MTPRRVLIMGAAGRDFHNFNLCFRDNEEYEVVGFTATQIPNITDRRYPAALAGGRYREGITIYEEDQLADLIPRLGVDLVVFAYSDVSHQHVMHKGSIVIAAGADFALLGFNATSLKSKRPVVSVCAVRTGAGKSQTTRRVCMKLKERGRKVVAIRHPMPYGDLVKQRVQRFATFEDLDRFDCTIEEREEYEPHIKNDIVVYAGVDYGAILAEAEKEADVIVWDGGNNDLPFYKPDVEIVVIDPHRPGHELKYHPGEANLRRASCIIINKIDTADKKGIETVKENIAALNPKALVIEAASPVTVEDPAAIRGKRVLVVEDGPTLTHGEMRYGAGVIAAQRFGAASLVDPRPYAVGSIARTFEKYPGIGTLLPAVGYGETQMQELKQTIDRVDCDLVLIATPIDLRRTIHFDRKALRVSYELQEIGKPDLDDVLARLP
ncbi:MAG TPA: cyclic 2,3-diphosphoglycerate synthase [Candidatus Polarisedimenticolia bacterium]|nr:cyclic 2,3-diphosphoglycerate synthase [Candidatus Polarisedimenticolia bacterium]